MDNNSSLPADHTKLSHTAHSETLVLWKDSSSF